MPHKDRHILAVLADQLAESCVVFFACLYSVGDKRVVDQRRVEFDDDLALDELLLHSVGASRLVE